MSVVNEQAPPFRSRFRSGVFEEKQGDEVVPWDPKVLKEIFTVYVVWSVQHLLIHSVYRI